MRQGIIEMSDIGPVDPRYILLSLELRKDGILCARKNDWSIYSDFIVCGFGMLAI